MSDPLGRDPQDIGQQEPDVDDTPVEVVGGIEQLFTDPVARRKWLDALDFNLTHYEEDDAKEDGIRSSQR